MAGTENDELEKIMSEIEELQKEMSSSSSEVAETPKQMDDSAEQDILSEIQASAQTGAQAGEGLEETLGELKQEEPDISGPLNEIDHEEETMPNSDQGNDGTLSLTLTGNMTLKLKYEYEGQEVTISFADQALRVQMTDGTEFKVPVVRTAAPSNVRPIKKAV